MPKYNIHRWKLLSTSPDSTTWKCTLCPIVIRVPGAVHLARKPSSRVLGRTIINSDGSTTVLAIDAKQPACADPETRALSPQTRRDRREQRSRLLSFPDKTDVTAELDVVKYAVGEAWLTARIGPRPGPDNPDDDLRWRTELMKLYLAVRSVDLELGADTVAEVAAQIRRWLYREFDQLATRHKS